MTGMLESMLGDVRWAVRSLRRRPTLTAVAVATLALGIGANSAIFALASAQFLTSLPYDHPRDVVLLWETERNTTEEMTVAPGNYFLWKEQAASLADVAAYNVDFADLSGGTSPAERVTASYVTPNFFGVLGVRPELGSGFDEASSREASDRLLILGHALWVRRYGADPSILGKDIQVDGAPYTVVGVMPSSFRQPERSLTWQTTELWRPEHLDGRKADFGSRYLRAVARLRSGETADQAQAEMTALATRSAQEHPAEDGGRTVLVRPIQEYLLGDARPIVFFLLAAGGAVFLIVCANVANLTLARGEERRREFAVRAALGSGRRRLVRQLLVEGMVVALFGALVGTALVYGGRGALEAVQTRFFTGLIDVRVDLRVVGFTVLAALGAGVLSSLPLARYASRSALHEALVEGSARSGAGRGAGATRNLLVLGQVGVATALLAVAGLLGRSLNRLTHVPPGFDPRGVVTFDLTAPPEGGREGTKSYFRSVRDELQRIPGVREVGMISDLPFTTENRWTELSFNDREIDPSNPPQAEYHLAVPEYFQVMSIPLLEGSLPGASWDLTLPMPVVVNQDMAARFWPGGDALGATFELHWADTVPATVAGVVGNVLDDGYSGAPEPIFYAPFGTMVNRAMSMVVQVSGDPSKVLPDVRTAVARVDPAVPAADLRLLTAMLAETVAQPRAASLIGRIFALLAALVAATGIYGVLSYAVERRTREIGIRAALGASSRELLNMVLSHTTRLLVMGLLMGCGVAVLAGRTLSRFLFQVQAWDPVSLLGAVVLLGAVGGVAAWIPARRAVRVDPREALRIE